MRRVSRRMRTSLVDTVVLQRSELYWMDSYCAFALHSTIFHVYHTLHIHLNNETRDDFVLHSRALIDPDGRAGRDICPSASADRLNSDFLRLFILDDSAAFDDIHDCCRGRRYCTILLGLSLLAVQGYSSRAYTHMCTTGQTRTALQRIKYCEWAAGSRLCTSTSVNMYRIRRR